MADSGHTMIFAPSASRLRSRYISSVFARFSTSHFSSCGIAPCSSAMSMGSPAGRVHSCPSSSQPPSHSAAASAIAVKRRAPSWKKTTMMAPAVTATAKVTR